MKEDKKYCTDELAFKKLRIWVLSILLISLAGNAEINYSSDQSNFMGITISDSDLDQIVMAIGDAGGYCLNTGFDNLPPAERLKISSLLWIWKYDLKVHYKTNMRFTLPTENSSPNTALIGFRTDVLSYDGVASFSQDGDDLRWAQASEFPICGKDEYFDFAISLKKDIKGKYGLEVKLADFILMVDQKKGYPITRKINDNFLVQIIGKYFNNAPSFLMATSEPTLTVSDHKLLIGWMVKKEDPPNSYAPRSIFNSNKLLIKKY